MATPASVREMQNRRALGAAAAARWANPEYRASCLAGQRRQRARIAAGEGFVYVARVVGRPAIKIGFSLQPKRRMGPMSREFGVKVRLLAFMPGSINDERALHSALRDCPRPRVARNGEFYDLSAFDHEAFPAALRPLPRKPAKKARAG